MVFSVEHYCRDMTQRSLVWCITELKDETEVDGVVMGYSETNESYLLVDFHVQCPRSQIKQIRLKRGELVFLFPSPIR